MIEWKGNVTILALIQQACEDATSTRRPDLSARFVVNGLNRGGWKIVWAGRDEE